MCKGSVGNAENIAKDVLGIWASHTMQRVESESEVGTRCQRFDCSKVKHLRKRVGIVGNAVDHLDTEHTDIGNVEFILSDAAQIHLQLVGRNLVRLDRFSVNKDLVRNRLGRRP
jgi:hypothetical protein